MKYLIGLDVGTSGAKCIMIDENGKVIASSTQEYPLSTPRPGWAEQNPADWWEAVVRGLKAILSSPEVNKEDIVGLGFSSQWVCPHSMMPDVIEQDELMTGERREGIYFGMNATAGKITGALGSAICGWGLELGGYVENAEQTASALTAIRGMFALIPALLLLVCVPLLIRYPITRESHAQVLRQLEERRKELNK